MLRLSSSAMLVGLVAMTGLLAQPSFAAPITIDDLLTDNTEYYLGIHMGTKDSGAGVLSVGSDGGEAGSNNRSSLGRINPTNDQPASQPGIPAPTGTVAQTVPDGSDAPVSTFGGNFALTGSDSQVDLSNTDTYASGDSSSGFQCANSDCIEKDTDDGYAPNSNFFTPDSSGTNPDVGNPIGEDQGLISAEAIAPDYQGVTENVTFTALMSDITAMKTLLSGLTASDFTATIDLTGSGGTINNYNSDYAVGDFLVGSNLTGGSMIDGLNVIKIVTGENDFNMTNSNFIVNGSANSTFIFVVETPQDMLVTQSRILAGENMGLNNILFVVLADTNDTHFNFSQSEIYGAAFWDLSSKDNDWDGQIVLNNVRGCGQWVSNALVDWNDVSVDKCAFNPSTQVPAPGALGFLGLGLIGFGYVRRRRAA